MFTCRNCTLFTRTRQHKPYAVAQCLLAQLHCYTGFQIGGPGTLATPDLDAVGAPGTLATPKLVPNLTGSGSNSFTIGDTKLYTLTAKRAHTTQLYTPSPASFTC